MSNSSLSRSVEMTILAKSDLKLQFCFHFVCPAGFHYLVQSYKKNPYYLIVNLFLTCVQIILFEIPL